MYQVKKVVNGVLYLGKEQRISKAKLMGKIITIEQKSDKNDNTYFSVFILNSGENSSIRWNFFNEKGKLFKVNDLIIADGVFYSENKRLLRSMKLVR